MPVLWQEVRYAWRGLRANPVFTITAVLTLALGIGANTAIFSILDGLLLRKLPVRNPDQLVLVHCAGSLQDVAIWERAAFEAYRDRNTVFSGVLAFSPINVSTMTHNGRTTSAQVEYVSGNYFTVLDVPPFAGRLSSADDDSPVAVLSFDYWKREFQSDPHAVGKVLLLENVAHTVVGVAPPDFFGAVVGASPDLYVPFSPKSPNAGWVTVLARLKPGISREQAQTGLQPLFDEIARRSLIPAVERRQMMARLLVTPAARGLSDLRAQYSLPVRIAMAFVGFVLLIACFNVANLLLARGIARERESAIRLALGAGRWRLIRQLMTESALLSVIGAAVGICTGRWISALLVSSLSTARHPIVLDTGLTDRAVVFGVAISVLSVLCCGLAPALSASRLKPGRQSGLHLGHSSPHSRLGTLLAVGQVALSMTVLICSLLLLHSLIELETFDAGFDRNHVLAVQLGGNAAGESPRGIEHFYNQLVSQVESLPEVRMASLSVLTPIGGREIGINIAVEGYTPGSSEETHAFLSSVTPGYFQTLGIPMLAGRDFNSHDNPASPRVAVINRAMARHFFGDGNAVGRRFRFVEGGGRPMEIVGVVADSKYNDLREKTPDFVYLCSLQGGRPSSITGVLHVRFQGNSSRSLSAKLRNRIDSIDSSVRIAGIRTLQEQIGESLHEDRLISALGGALSLMALILTCVGLYGSVSFRVARRRSEIGIRMALGAERGMVLSLILREVTALVLAGVALGIPIALAASRSIAGMLFRVPAYDPSVIALSAAILVAVALLAGYAPARRAARIDPMAALRFE